jgi:DNA primase
MAGRIRDDDVVAVRDKARIDEVIGEYVQLRNAGGGNLKGICPFHDEKSPSLSVSPARGLYHCFGCSAGGDVIKFVQDIEHLAFTEAVESLAARVGIQLRYAEGGSGPARSAGQRAKLVQAHVDAAAFYAAQLALPEAQPARDFLSQRGFDAAVTARFGCGYAPSGWDSLTKHLLGKGFSPAELTLAGLSRESGRGSLIDRFHRRLLWPIKDVSGDVVGFGARRLYDDDKVEAKYLNTPETPIYKKSQLLYGMDVAKREIAKQHKAVVVEGYTDVMACHLAGVTTAVATCGTAFGSEHMRQAGGDPAVRSLVDSRVPLVEFVLRSTVSRQNLDSAEGRMAALDKGIPLVAMIKDYALRDEYARLLAGYVGVDDPIRVVARVRALVRSSESAARAGAPAAGRPGLNTAAPQAQTAPVGGVSAKVSQSEREVIKAALQLPDVVGKQFDELGPGAFLVAVHQQLQAAVAAPVRSGSLASPSACRPSRRRAPR